MSEDVDGSQDPGTWSFAEEGEIIKHDRDYDGEDEDVIRSTPTLPQLSTKGTLQGCASGGSGGIVTLSVSGLKEKVEKGKDPDAVGGVEGMWLDY